MLEGFPWVFADSQSLQDGNPRADIGDDRLSSLGDLGLGPGRHRVPLALRDVSDAADSVLRNRERDRAHCAKQRITGNGFTKALRKFLEPHPDDAEEG